MARNPRLTASVKPEVYDLVTRVTEITGLSHSRVLADLLEQTLPVLKMILENLEKLERAKTCMDQEVKTKLIGQLDRAAKRSEKRLKKDLGEFENVISIR